MNNSSILENSIRIDILRSILSDTSDIERARSNFVFLISPIHLKLCFNSIQCLQSFYLESRQLLMNTVVNSYSLTQTYEIPRLREFVRMKLKRIQIILQGFQIKIDSESHSCDIQSSETRFAVIREILSDLLSLAVCFPPPFKNRSVGVAKSVGVNRLVALGLLKSIAILLVEDALSRLQVELRKTDYSSYFRRGLFSPSRRHTDHKGEPDDSNLLVFMIKCVVDASIKKMLGEPSATCFTGETWWDNAVVIKLSSGIRLDWEQYTFDSKFSGIVGDILLCDGFGSHFLTIRHPDSNNASADRDGNSVNESTYSAFREFGVYFSLTYHDCQNEFIDGGSSCSVLSDDLAIEDNIRHRENITELSSSIGNVDVHFADKQFSHFLDAINALMLDIDTDRASDHNETSDLSAPLAMSVDIANVDILFTTDELQPFCSFKISELCIDFAKTSALELQKRKFLVTAKSSGFYLDDLSPEGQIYSRVLHPLNECDHMNLKYPFQMTFAMSTDPALYQNEVIIIFDEIRCYLLRRFVNELLQYFLYTDYGVGHFLAVRSAALQINDTSPSRIKAPISYQLHLLGSSVICPVSSDSEDLIALESSKIVMSNIYLRESWPMPVVGKPSVSKKGHDDESILVHEHGENDSDVYDFQCHHSTGGSVIYDDKDIFEYIPGSFDRLANVSRITVTIQDLKIFVGISDLHMNDEPNEDIYYLMKYLQLSDIVNGGLVFAGVDDLDQDLFVKTRRYDDIRSRRWHEITPNPVQLEVYADFINKTQMRILVKDRITYALPETEEMHPFEIKLKMSQFNTLLSIWYGNMQVRRENVVLFSILTLFLMNCVLHIGTINVISVNNRIYFRCDLRSGVSI